MPVYLDHAATTPLDAAVLEAMMPYLTDHFGNASSVHALGRRARFAVEESRERVAAVLGAEPAEVVFTSGGTEADNAALRGVLAERSGPLVTSAVEHEAVLHTAQALAAEGRAVDVRPPGASGAVAAGDLDDVVDGATALVSLMYVNNETGAVTDLAAVADVCRARGVPLHTDAVQAPGLLALDVDALGVDLLSLSAHKFYGPKGVGVLYVRGGTPWRPLLHGGSQERKRRAGTENVAAVVGLATALERAAAGVPERAARVAALRDRLLAGLRSSLGDAIVVNTPLGHAAAPHILNLAFPPAERGVVDGEMLLLGLDMEGVCASSGSACTSGTVTPSHVLLALGRDRATASAALRFSLGTRTTEDEVDRAVDAVARVARRVGALA